MWLERWLGLEKLLFPFQEQDKMEEIDTDRYKDGELRLMEENGVSDLEDWVFFVFVENCLDF